MPRQIRGPDGVLHTFPDDATDAEITEALSASEKAPSGGGWSDAIAGALPTLGGLAGGITGGIGGATVGGMAGQGYGELLKHAGEIPGALADVARNVVTQPRATLQGFLQGANEGAVNAGLKGASEGVGQAVGGAVGKGVAQTGKLVYKGGVALLPKGIKQEFPDLAEAGFREGVSLTNRGAAKAEKLVGQSAQQATDKLAIMERAGSSPVQPHELVSGMTRTAGKVSKQPLRADDLQTISDMRTRVLAENPNPIPLTQANEMKQAAQRVATQGYKQIDRGAPINSVPLDVNMDIAHALRQAIESRVPSVGPINARTQDLIGLQRAAEHAGGTGHWLSRVGGAGVLGGLGFTGGGFIPALGAAAAGGAMATPGGATTTGLMLKGAAPYAEHGSARLAALLAQLASE